jgi:hypothetical protein
MDGFFREARQWYHENKHRDLYEELWFHYACQNCFIAGGTTLHKDRINLEDLFLCVDQRCQEVREQVPSKRKFRLLEIIRSALSTELFALDDLHQVLKEIPDSNSFMREVAKWELQRLELVAWRIIRLHLIFLIAAFLVYRTANQICQHHEKLASRLMPGDAVISFNYDTIMGRALDSTVIWDYSEGYGVSFDPQERRGCCEVPQLRMENGVLLLKPHGSLNWVAVLEPSVFAGAPDQPLGRPLGYINAKNAIYGWRKAFPLSKLTKDGEVRIEAPAIIPPVKGKETFIGDLNDTTNQLIPGREQAGEYLYVHPYQPIRDLCERAVRSAGQILFIGYSLPQTDRWASDLFAKAPRHCSIQIINPETGVLERYQKLFPGRAEWICPTLAEYVGC